MCTVVIWIMYHLLFAQDIFLYWAEIYLKQESTFIMGGSFDWIF